MMYYSHHLFILHACHSHTSTSYLFNTLYLITCIFNQISIKSHHNNPYPISFSFTFTFFFCYLIFLKSHNLIFFHCISTFSPPHLYFTLITPGLHVKIKNSLCLAFIHFYIRLILMVWVQHVSDFFLLDHSQYLIFEI